MKLELGKHYKTRDGRKVRIICVDKMSDSHPIVGLILEGDWEAISAYTEQGKYATYDSHEDIVSEWREPITVEGWVNVNDSFPISKFYKTKFEADAGAGADRIACVKVKGVEGDE